MEDVELTYEQKKFIIEKFTDILLYVMYNNGIKNIEMLEGMALDIKRLGYYLHITSELVNGNINSIRIDLTKEEKDE